MENVKSDTMLSRLLRRAVALFLAVLLLPAVALAQGEPVTRTLDGGITHINLNIPVSNGKFVRSDVYLPTTATPAPGVLVFPTYYVIAIGGSEDADRNYAIELAKVGYATLVPALSHLGTNAGYDPKHADDILILSRWLRERPEVMDDRIAGVGFSMGGYHSALLATFDPTARAAIGYYGLYDIENPKVVFSKAIQRYWDGAPARHIAEVKAAVLLLHGESDSEVRAEQALTYRDRLLAAGKTAEAVVYSRAHHRFDRGRTSQMQNDTTRDGHLYVKDSRAQADAWQRTVAWLDKYLRAD